jgi:hypothetical protein
MAKRVPAPNPGPAAAPPKEDKLSEADLAEARRIAAELVKLHKVGAIKDANDPEAVFYANVIHGFQAEFIGKREQGNHL